MNRGNLHTNSDKRIVILRGWGNCLFFHEVKNPARRCDDEVDFLVDPHDVVLQVSSAWLEKEIHFILRSLLPVHKL